MVALYAQVKIKKIDSNKPFCIQMEAGELLHQETRSPKGKGSSLDCGSGTTF